MNSIQSFWGRAQELKLLGELRKKRSASFVTVTGRRRIGKSRLIQEFAQSHGKFFKFQGLFPNKGITRQDQLQEFADDLSKQFNAPKMRFETWTQAFNELALRTQKLECVILLDEISWMAHDDPLFSSQLQKVWNTEFTSNSKLILVVCGSVSSWIEDNVIQNANFVGRVSLQIHLQELTLSESKHFWDKYSQNNLSSYEKLKILAVTGGVPKYLEELVTKESSEKSIVKKCFHESGFLFNDFDKIFSEIFMKKAPGLEKIIRRLEKEKMPPATIAKILKLDLNSHFSNQIDTLILSGFCERDYSYLPSGERSKNSKIRLKDNYLKFYLKYIEPHKSKIKSKSLIVRNLDQIMNWDSVLGLQFENLILNSKSSLLPHIDMDESDVLVSSPYFQKKSTRIKESAQVDLLIHTRRDLFFVCEFKCVKMINKSLIKEVQRKIDVIPFPKRASVRPVLVYEGQLNPNDEGQLRDYFDTIIHVSQLMELTKS